MTRRLSWTAAIPAALALAATTVLAGPAAAVGPFGPAETLIPGCTEAAGDAAIAPDGTTRGFANCTGAFTAGAIRYLRDTPGSAPVAELAPYRGVVVAVAWDGQDSTYVVIDQGSTLRIGKRVESTGAYSPLTTLSTAGGATRFLADVVASHGQWWAVWTEAVGPTEFAPLQLFQRHTLLGVQGRTRITATPAGVEDFFPSLALSGNRVTMVWERFTNSNTSSSSDLVIADSTGGAWNSRLLASLGFFNETPDVTVNAGVTWVTWERDGRIFVADNHTGAFVSRAFSGAGFQPTVAVSGSNAFVTWTASDRVVLAELAGGVWTSAQVEGASSFPLRVVAQGTKARVVYWRETDLVIRTQT